MSHGSLKHPGRWLWLLLAIPVAFGLYRLRFDAEVFDLLPGDVKPVAGLKVYQEHFANARELIITLKGVDAEITRAAAQSIATNLRQQPALIESVTWQPPWLERPELSAELIGYLWLNQPPETFRALAASLSASNVNRLLTSAREELATSMSPQQIGQLSYDPFGLTRLPESAQTAAPSFTQGNEMFSSPDGTFRMIFVQASHDLRTYHDCDKWLKQVQVAIASGGPVTNGVSVAFTGRPAFVAEVALGMQHDMTESIGGTSIIIAILFWIAHRRLKPMLWLLTLLALILGSTLALGGLFYGTINVVSMGFAAILLGLAVDYAVVHYQEALAHPNLSIPQIRSAIAPSIFWAAVTTISAFLVLNLGGLPGLGQLGSLVGLGVALSACIMIFEFLPPLFPERRNMAPAVAAETPAEMQTAGHRASPKTVFAISALIVLAVAGVLLVKGPPAIDPTANALRPRHSTAYDAMNQIQRYLNQEKEPLWVIAGGNSIEEVGKRLEKIEATLEVARSNNWIERGTLALPLWPRPVFQTQNKSTATELLQQQTYLEKSAASNGFAPNSLALAKGVFSTWQDALKTAGVFWPTNDMSRWIFQKLVARETNHFYALGFINTPTNFTVPQMAEKIAKMQNDLNESEIWISGWGLLGNAIFIRVKANMWKLLVPMVTLVMLSLWLAFRRPTEILLSLAVLFLSALVLLAIMQLFHWSWNLLNLMAVPLMLGAGVDYSIFMQLALRRYHGNLRIAHLAVGRALFLCGGTAIAGFGSLAFSSNAGMASLGQVCAVGIASNMLIAVFLLPAWWKLATKYRDDDGAATAPASPVPTATPRGTSRLDAPSSLYRAGFWQLGLWVVRIVPRPLCRAAGVILAELYMRLAPARKEIVVQNLLPALGGDRQKAEAATKRLFRNFSTKVLDLWRYEAGLPIEHLFGEATGFDHFQKAWDQKKGVLLITPHLGNWEFGGPWLTRHGVRLQVITLAEPGTKFTQMREASRARWNIDTLVIGDDPFAFVEVIRKLEAGATVALLIDRPSPQTEVMVDLFGHQFPASMAAAELARASGCVLMPVYIPKGSRAYTAHVISPIEYDRAELRSREARQRLTQRIMSAFEPVIRERLDQWYHFIPVWKENRLRINQS
jgi:predicted RND superfamily exporter protein/lauroyl/myristoyl acyltransferase